MQRVNLPTTMFFRFISREFFYEINSRNGGIKRKGTAETSGRLAFTTNSRHGGDYGETIVIRYGIIVSKTYRASGGRTTRTTRLTTETPVRARTRHTHTLARARIYYKTVYRRLSTVRDRSVRRSVGSGDGGGGGTNEDVGAMC